MSSSPSHAPPPSGQRERHAFPDPSDDELHSEPLPGSDDEEDTVRANPESGHEDADDEYNNDSDSYLTSSDNERPNRHRGTAKEWRAQYEVERRIAGSLDNERAKDLSIHLYNAYALEVPEQEDDGRGWRLRAGWTAWPLEPEFVPRPEEEVGENDDHVPLDSRQHLQEVLIAMATKAARERFLGRMKQRAAEVTEENSVSESGPSSSGSEGELDVEAKGGSSDDDQPLVQKLPEWQLRSLKAEDEMETAKVAEPFHLAIPNTDPELETELLRQSMGQLQSQFDKVLLGLHESRKNAQRAEARSRSPSGSPRSVSSQVANRGRKRSRSAVSDKNGRSRSSQSVRRARIKPRDWSDVLGMAAITQAFSPEVLERAKARCAELLRQDMDFKQSH